MEYAIEMLHITKRFPGIIANDDITLQLKKGEIHALLGENGAGKSTLMSILFGMYQAENGEIFKNGKKIKIRNPNDANELGIGMVHQHFKLIECFSVLDNIILGVEPNKIGFLQKKEARTQVIALSKKYGFNIDPDAIVENITIGMQQKTEILKMLYRNNDILIFDEPTAVLTPQEINELLKIMKNLANEGKSILFISHKLNEIMEIADRCTVLRKGKYIGTVNISETSPEELSHMMVGRNVNFKVEKQSSKPSKTVLEINNLTIYNKEKHKNSVNQLSLEVKAGEIVCIAGIDGNGQIELIHGISGLKSIKSGNITICGKDSTHSSIRKRYHDGMGHIPEDRHKYGLVLDYTLEDNLILQRYYEPEFVNKIGFMKKDAIRSYSEKLISVYDIRSAEGSISQVRAMSGGNQQKAIIAREIDRNPGLLLAIQPTRGLDIGAIEFVHKKLVEHRDKGNGILLVSFELDEVMALSDRILVMYEGEIVGEFNPNDVTVDELGLYMAGNKRMEVKNEIVKK